MASETREVAGAARGDPLHSWGPPCCEISFISQEFLQISPAFTAIINMCEHIKCFAANMLFIFRSVPSALLEMRYIS